MKNKLYIGDKQGNVFKMADEKNFNSSKERDGMFSI